MENTNCPIKVRREYLPALTDAPIRVDEISSNIAGAVEELTTCIRRFSKAEKRLPLYRKTINFYFPFHPIPKKIVEVKTAARETLDAINMFRKLPLDIQKRFEEDFRVNVKTLQVRCAAYTWNAQR